MPQRISIADEWMPPSERMISRPVKVLVSPRALTVTPVARRPSKATSVTVAPLMMVRLPRARTSAVR